jgi:hypothetical protein
MSNLCAFNIKSKNESCLDESHINEITQKTEGKTLEDVMQETNCTDDICLLDSINIDRVIKERIKREAFKPEVKSLDGNYWLNNTEIDTAMSQLRKMYPGFAHGFIHMIDLKTFEPANNSTFDYKVFPCTEIDFGKEFKYGLTASGILKEPFDYSPKLSTYNNEPLNSYGIICNTDLSSGSGQHWFAIFISTDLKYPQDTSKPWIRIELFNSAGGGVSDDKFNTFWTDQSMKIAKETGLPCTYDIISTIQHQRDDTGNCGAYSLFYMHCRVNNEHPNQFNDPNKRILDSDMERFRKIVFRIDDQSPFSL